MDGNTLKPVRWRALVICVIRFLPPGCDGAKPACDDDWRRGRKFCVSHGMERVSPEIFSTPLRYEQYWQRARKGQQSSTIAVRHWIKTENGHRGGRGVGFRRQSGAATSTGGMTNKLPGRVGDSP